MIVTTGESVPGQEITEIVGLVKGSTVRGAHAGDDMQAWFKNLVGGELEEYTALLAQAREQALDRMLADARAKGAQAVIGLRFSSCEITDGAAEFLVYGTAVRLSPRKA